MVANAASSGGEATGTRRLTITLDSGLVLERLILRRLTGLQGKRRQAWLRSLLAQGFLTENRWLRTATLADRKPYPAWPVRATAFSRWLAGCHSQGGSGKAPPPVRGERAVQPPRAPGAGKPFAHLRKVIGTPEHDKNGTQHD